jgi:hypothetical protein
MFMPSIEVGQQVIKEIQPPKKISEQEIKAAEKEAADIAADILSEPENRLNTQRATRLGDDIQMRSNGEFKLLRTRLAN